MLLVTSWIWIEEYNIDPVITDPLSETEGKHRLNSSNTRDDTITIITIALDLLLLIYWDEDRSRLIWSPRWERVKGLVYGS